MAICTPPATTLTSSSKDFKTYELEEIHWSQTPAITKLNQEIVNKVNSMGGQRIAYKEAVFFGGSDDDKKMAAKNVSNLKKHVHRLQLAVESKGGVYFEIPKLFDDVPEE